MKRFSLFDSHPEEETKNQKYEEFQENGSQSELEQF
jgi:hypothetical protein